MIQRAAGAFSFFHSKSSCYATHTMPDATRLAVLFHYGDAYFDSDILPLAPQPTVPWPMRALTLQSSRDPRHRRFIRSPHQNSTDLSTSQP